MDTTAIYAVRFPCSYLIPDVFVQTDPPVEFVDQYDRNDTVHFWIIYSMPGKRQDGRPDEWSNACMTESARNRFWSIRAPGYYVVNEIPWIQD